MDQCFKVDGREYEILSMSKEGQEACRKVDVHKCKIAGIAK